MIMSNSMSSSTSLSSAIVILDPAKAFIESTNSGSGSILSEQHQRIERSRTWLSRPAAVSSRAGSRGEALASHTMSQTCTLNFTPASGKIAVLRRTFLEPSFSKAGRNGGRLKHDGPSTLITYRHKSWAILCLHFSVVDKNQR